MGKRSDFGDACVIWTGCVGRDGYGHVKRGRKVVSAHRVAYANFYGVEPGGHVLHNCDTPLCVNPKHLRVGTHKENMEDCARKGRNRSPRIGNGFQKLTEADLLEIRRLASVGSVNKSEVARKYGVTPTRIRQVINGQKK